MILPESVDGLRCPRCRSGSIRILSRTIIDQGPPSGRKTLDGECERCGLTMRYVSAPSDIADIVNSARRVVDGMGFRSGQNVKLYNLIESLAECVRANAVEGIFKSISSVIDINLVRASTDDEFGRAFEARVRVDTFALDQASLGLPVDSAPSNAIEVFQRIKKAIYDDGVIATTTDTSRDRSVHGISLGDAPDIRRFSSDRAPNGPGLDRVTIRSDIHATDETNWRRPPRRGPQVTPMTDEDIAYLTRPDHEMDSMGFQVMSGYERVAAQHHAAEIESALEAAYRYTPQQAASEVASSIPSICRRFIPPTRG